MSVLQHPEHSVIDDSPLVVLPDAGPIKGSLESMASVAVASSRNSTRSAGITSLQTRVVVDDKIGEFTSKQAQHELELRLEFERVTAAIHRANLEQSRRACACLRQAYEMLVRHTAQPCLLLDMDGRITRWNPALEQWSGIPREIAENRMLPDLMVSEVLARLTSAQLALVTADGPAADRQVVVLGPLELFPQRTAAKFTLLPVYRIPDYLEAILILIEPQG